MCAVGDASPHGLTPWIRQAARRRCALGRPNYRRLWANYGHLPAQG